MAAPIGIQLPNAMVFEVVETNPVMKTATKSSSFKPAKLDNGVTINVPEFIQIGEKVRVNPSTGRVPRPREVTAPQARVNPGDTEGSDRGLAPRASPPSPFRPGPALPAVPFTSLPSELSPPSSAVADSPQQLSDPGTRGTPARHRGLFLPLLGIALHKCTAYPPGHPLLKSALEAVAGHLRVVLVNRPFLLLGVARSQLLVEGLATDPDNPVLRELATRLHRHQLGAIKFFTGA